MRLLLLLSFKLALIGCSTATLVLNSSPEQAEVWVGSGTNYVQIGNTPLTISKSELKNQLTDDGPYFFRFVAENHTPKEVILTNIPTQSEVFVSITLEKKESPWEERKDEVNAIIDDLFETQRLARVERYSDALEKIKRVQERHPSLSAAYELEGGIYFLQENFREAYDAYLKAYRLNPTNLESFNMTQYLRARIEGTGEEQTPTGAGP